MKKILFLLSIFSTLITFFSGCQSSPKIQGSKTEPVYITNSKKFYLLSPKEIPSPFEKQIMFEGEFQKKNFSLLSYLQATEQELYINILTDFGTSLGEIIYNGTEIVFDSAIFPKNLKPEYIISDLQFAYYDFNAVKTSLNKIHIGFFNESTDSDSSKIFTIRNGLNATSPLIEKITHSKNIITIENFLRGYKYILTEAQE